jgi:hypothetical protein
LPSPACSRKRAKAVVRPSAQSARPSSRESGRAVQGVLRGWGLHSTVESRLSLQPWPEGVTAPTAGSQPAGGDPAGEPRERPHSIRICHARRPRTRALRGNSPRGGARAEFDGSAWDWEFPRLWFAWPLLREHYCPDDYLCCQLISSAQNTRDAIDESANPRHRC